MKINKIAAVIFFILFSASLALYFVWSGREGKTATVYLDGEVYTQIDLASEREIVLPHNTLLVSDGGVSVTEADCPDKICMQRGAMRGGLPIVCMPNRVTVIVDDEGVDALSW